MPTSPTKRKSSQPTDAQIIAWVAEFVLHINTMVHKGPGRKLEVEAEDDDWAEVVTMLGSDYEEAFRKCITELMRRYKLFQENKEFLEEKE